MLCHAVSWWQWSPMSVNVQGYDLIEDMYSTKTAAMNFVHELCKSRGKNNLSSFMQFVVQVMTEYQVCFTWR